MKRLIPLLIFIFLATSCRNGITDPERPDRLPRELTASEMELIESDIAFSYDLFRQVHQSESEDWEEPENIFISPLSVSMALGMVLNGAAGETREEMRQALRKERMSMEEINTSYKSLIGLLVNLDPKVQVKIANSLWYRAELSPLEPFRNAVVEYFDATEEGVDFNDPETVDRINGWVSNNTEGLIEEIVTPPIDPDMIAYLINALYFKGSWLNQFDEEDTQKLPFHLENGEQVEVDMMHNEKKFHSILKNDEVHLLDIPYGDSLYSMTLMMPHDPEIPLGSFIEENINRTVVDGWIGEAEASLMDINLPKFRVDYNIDLPDIMDALGMKKAFSEIEADFSNMFGSSGIFISKIRHKTFVMVNEEGTEAAAATSVGIALTSAPPDITFDRPFVYLIRERISGTILFIGTMQNPSAG